jgi:hypothetical protein
MNYELRIFNCRRHYGYYELRTASDEALAKSDYGLRMIFPAASSQQPAASSQQPAASSQQPAAFAQVFRRPKKAGGELIMKN